MPVCVQNVLLSILAITIAVPLYAEKASNTYGVCSCGPKKAKATKRGAIMIVHSTMACRNVQLKVSGSGENIHWPCRNVRGLASPLLELQDVSTLSQNQNQSQNQSVSAQITVVDKEQKPALKKVVDPPVAPPPVSAAPVQPVAPAPDKTSEVKSEAIVTPEGKEDAPPASPEAANRGDKSDTTTMPLE